MWIEDLRLDNDKQELTKHGTPIFPIGFYHLDLEDYVEKGSPWHWHHQIELNLIIDGCDEVRLNSGTLTLHKGEGIFINSGILHSQTVRDVGNGHCEMLAIVFDPSLIYGEPGSILDKKFVEPLLNTPWLDCVTLSPEEKWSLKALGEIRKAFYFYEEKSFGYELLIRNSMSELWYMLVTSLQEELISPEREVKDESRVKDMITFIQTHYMEPISLEDVAAAGNISERECNRTFQEQLKTSPFTYLNNYRIRRASYLLAETDQSVLDIALAVGFNASSYFGQLFRKGTGMTPREFRENSKSGQSGQQDFQKTGNRKEDLIRKNENP